VIVVVGVLFISLSIHLFGAHSVGGYTQTRKKLRPMDHATDLTPVMPVDLGLGENVGLVEVSPI
jgi:hypothetical protein